MSFRDEIPRDFLEVLDELGLERVRARIEAHRWNEAKNNYASIYVTGREQELQREAEAAQLARTEREEARADESLELARRSVVAAEKSASASEISAKEARSSRRTAMVALVISAIATIATIVIAITAYITLNSPSGA